MADKKHGANVPHETTKGHEAGHDQAKHGKATSHEGSTSQHEAGKTPSKDSSEKGGH